MESSVRSVCFSGDFTVKTVHAQKFAENATYVEVFLFQLLISLVIYIRLKRMGSC